MRDEEEGIWFARWEEELPTPEELMPLSQTLITPDLALAFDIPTYNSHPSPPSLLNQLRQPTPAVAHQPPEYDSGDLRGGGSCGPDEPARTLKRPRLVWTPQLHKRFVDAVAHLGIKNAVPKTIMQLMSVDGLTRENVASHLQKYRLYLKRMQGLSSSSGGGGGHISAADDQLFASGPVPHHFLNRGPGLEPFSPYVQHHQHMATAAAVQQQFYHQRQMGQFGSPTGTGPGFHRGPLGLGMIQPPPPRPQSSYREDLDSGSEEGGKKVLTLFPTGKD